MERPSNFSKKQLEYVEFLEYKLKTFSSNKTVVTSYMALKKTIDDINKILLEGMIITIEETGEQTRVDVVSAEALSSKDDKLFDRLFKFIDKIGSYNDSLEDLATKIIPEDLDKTSYSSEYEELQDLITKE